jgi:hypothetical protein
MAMIFMPLLTEGSDVWRPVEAEALDAGIYRITEQPADGEAWAFSVGSAVIVDNDGRIVAMLGAGD